MFFFTPRYLKLGRQFIKDARKLLAYKRDLVSEETIVDVEREIVHLEHAVKGRNEKEVEAQMERLDQACSQLAQPQNPNTASIRENVEVFLVAIIVAFAVRTFFLQPFTIPTGSMQPTLNGIIGHRTEQAPPSPVIRGLHLLLFGRTYAYAVAKADEQVIALEEEKRFGIFTFTRLLTSAGNAYSVWAPHEAVSRYLLDSLGQEVKKGEPIVQGYVETGDHVFVDKMTYHFRRPKRGEVFVFNTGGIEAVTPPGTPSFFYIKRLAGVPNDLLRIDAPKLFVNGQEAQEPGFQRVMTGTMTNSANGYRGYANGAERRGSTTVEPMTFLTSGTSTFEIPPKCYFALGDNSYNSSDSRVWGTVPQQNITGRALLVYWPFGKHWNFIH